MVIAFITSHPYEKMQGMFLFELAKYFPVTCFSSAKEFEKIFSSLDSKPKVVLFDDGATVDQSWSLSVMLPEFVDGKLNLQKAHRVYIDFSTRCPNIQPVKEYLQEVKNTLFSEQVSAAVNWNLTYKNSVLNIMNSTLSHTLTKEVISLAHKESQLLKLMLQNPQKTVSRKTICDLVWSGLKVSERNLDSHLSRLRKKIEPFELEINALYGKGYRLE